MKAKLFQQLSAEDLHRPAAEIVATKRAHVYTVSHLNGHENVEDLVAGGEDVVTYANFFSVRPEFAPAGEWRGNHYLNDFLWDAAEANDWWMRTQAGLRCRVDWPALGTPFLIDLGKVPSADALFRLLDYPWERDDLWLDMMFPGLPPWILDSVVDENGHPAMPLYNNLAYLSRVQSMLVQDRVRFAGGGNEFLANGFQRKGYFEHVDAVRFRAAMRQAPRWAAGWTAYGGVFSFDELEAATSIAFASIEGDAPRYIESRNLEVQEVLRNILV